MDALQALLDGFIDFQGQKLAENLITILLSVSGIVAWVVGFILQDLKYTVWIGLGGTALAIGVVVPPWWFYKKNPVGWLPASTTEDEGKKDQ